MVEFDDDLGLLSEFLASPNTGPRTRKIWDKLNRAYKRNPSSAHTQHLLNEYIKSVGDDVADASVSFLKSGTFLKLSNSGKASVIRDVMGAGLVNGFNETAKVTKEVYDAILKKNGYVDVAVLGEFDLKRFRSVNKMLIGDALDGDIESSANNMKATYRQIIQDGQRSTLARTGEVLGERGTIVHVRRRTTSSDPCDYCRERSGVMMRVYDDSSGLLFSFHDHCRCEIDIVIDKEL